MVDREKVIEGLQELSDHLFHDYQVCYHGDVDDYYKRFLQADAALELLKEQQETIVSLALNKENAEQTRESVKPTVDEFGNAYCVCGEHVGFFPQIHKELPGVRLNYCYECGRKMVWE